MCRLIDTEKNIDIRNKNNQNLGYVLYLDKNGNPKEVGKDKKNPEKLKLPPISQSNGAVQNKDNNNKVCITSS